MTSNFMFLFYKFHNFICLFNLLKSLSMYMLYYYYYLVYLIKSSIQSIFILKIYLTKHKIVFFFRNKNRGKLFINKFKFFSTYVYISSKWKKSFFYFMQTFMYMYYYCCYSWFLFGFLFIYFINTKAENSNVEETKSNVKNEICNQKSLLCFILLLFFSLACNFLYNLFGKLNRK